MTKTYSGYEISFNETTEVWFADLGELGTRQNSSLAKLKEAIDRAGKEKKKSRKQPAIFQPGIYGGHGGLQEGYVTSRAEVIFGGREEFWTVGGPKNERSKKNVERIFAADDYNRERVKRIKEIEEQIEGLDNDKSKLYASLHPFVWKEDEEKQ